MCNLLKGLVILVLMVCVVLAVKAGNCADTVSLDKYSLWSSATTLRGANIYLRHRINKYDGPGDQFVPSYNEDLFTSLRDAGANLVVLSMPGPYRVKSPYKVDKASVKMLDEWVDKAAKAGLFIVFAFRTAPGRNENDILQFLPTPVIRSLHKPNHKSQRTFARMWRFVAKRFKDNPNVVGYDLLVEPHSDGEDEESFQENWRKLSGKAINAIRAVDADTPILVQPSSWASPNALTQWQMPEGEKLILSVHQYEPYAYITNENEAGQILFDFSLTENSYQKIADFSLLFPEVPVAITEFGVKNICLNAGDFLEQQMDLIEEKGYNHAIWVWGNDSGQFDVRAESVFQTVTTNWKKNTTFP